MACLAACQSWFELPHTDRNDPQKMITHHSCGEPHCWVTERTLKEKCTFKCMTGKLVERQNCHLFALCATLFTLRRKVRLEQA